jgi:hypothetical protein
MLAPKVKIVEHPGTGKFWACGPWISGTPFRLGKIVNPGGPAPDLGRKPG